MGIEIAVLPSTAIVQELMSIVQETSTGVPTRCTLMTFLSRSMDVLGKSCLNAIFVGISPIKTLKVYDYLLGTPLDW